MSLAKPFRGLSATRCFPGRYCIRNFPGPLCAQAMSLLSINCYCCLLLLAFFSPLSHFFFFLVSSDPSSFFHTFNLLKLLHPYFGVKILFDVIINWENSEHDAMDEGSSPPTPFPLLSWWKVFNFAIQPQALVQSTVSIISPVREENKKCFQICKSA